MAVLKRFEFTSDGHTTSFLTGGPDTGPLVIFAHGWPDVAEVWRLQLEACVDHGWYVVAPDMRGYGASSAPRQRSAYALEILVKDMVNLLAHIGRKSAVWVGHDWGCAVLSSLAGHHPELVKGLALLSVTYRSLELGLDHLVSNLNRDLYPETEYPYGQLEYMKAYEADADGVDEALDAQPEKLIKFLYIKSDPSQYGKPSPTSRSLRDGLFSGVGWPNLPDLPLEATSLDESLFEALVETAKKNGFFPATSYYLNNSKNVEYSQTIVNEGILEMPVLFIDTKYDAVCSTLISPRVADEMHRTCHDLKEVCLDAGHWVHREKAQSVNLELLRWLDDKLA